MGFWSGFKKLKNIIDLSKQADMAMRRYIVKRLRELRKQSIKKMREIIIDQWYNNYYPVSYDRTEQFLQSVVCSLNEKNLSLTIGYDARLIKNKTRQDGWNVHRGFDGEDFKKGLINFIENGASGGLSPRNSDGGINALEQILEFMQDEINKETDNIYAEAVKIFIK